MVLWLFIAADEAKLKARGMKAYLDAMKGVMSNSRGKETYVVIFRRNLAECSNRWGQPARGDKREMEKWREEDGGWERTRLQMPGIKVTT